MFFLLKKKNSKYKILLYTTFQKFVDSKLLFFFLNSARMCQINKKW